MPDPPILGVDRPNPTHRVVERDADPFVDVSASDVLLIAGVVLATIAVAALSSIWWALLVPALACIASGIARARAGG